MGKDARATIPRIPFQIDRDVNLELPQQLRHFRIAFRSDIVKQIERRHQTGAHVAAVVGAERNSDDLEPRVVVELEQLRHQIRSRMPMIIRR